MKRALLLWCVVAESISTIFGRAKPGSDMPINNLLPLLFLKTLPHPRTILAEFLFGAWTREIEMRLV